MIQKNADLYVIGGGIIGLCSALEFQSQGLSVVILDADRIGSGASFGNAGHLAVEQVFPFADPSIIIQLPKMLLNPLGPITLNWRYIVQLFPWAIKLLLNMRQIHFKAIHEALKQINGISLPAWQQFAARWELKKWVHVQGSLLVAETLKGVDSLKLHNQKMISVGIPTQLINQDELLQREPSLATNQLSALFFPETGHVTNLTAVHQTLVKKFLLLGGQVQEFCKVEDIRHTVDGIELTTTTGTFNAKNILISMGAFSKKLVEKATGVSVPLDTERGYHLMLPNEKNRLSVPVTSVERRFIMTPMETGLRLAGTAEYAGLQLPANMKRAQMLLQLANPMFKDSLDNGQASQWMGFRPSTADSLPVIDKVGNVLLNFGHQHLGLTQAVSSAEILSSLYFEKQPKINPKPYRLNRFGHSHLITSH